MTQQTDQNVNSPSAGSPVSLAWIERIRVWMNPPVFLEDEEKTSKAAILNTLLVGTLAISITLGLTLPWSTPNGLPAFLFVLALITLLVIGLFNIRRGSVDSTSFAVVIISWLLAAAASAYFGGAASPAFASFIILILTAGLLLGHQPAIILTAISILYGLFLLFLESSGGLPEFRGNSISYLVFLSTIFLFASFFIYLILRNVVQALQQANLARSSLLESNQQFQELNTRLEEAAKDNAGRAEKRSRYLEASAQLIRSSDSTSNLQERLDLMVDQIAQHFDYYHVGIFLVEENGVWAVLQSASSEGGKKMIARNHRLGVGKQGMVGYVTSLGQVRLSQDIGLDRIHAVTPELPDTRAEIALPLKARSEIIGALDIQAKSPDAFDEEEISVLQIIADQVSLIIDNFRLYQEGIDRLAEVERVYGEYSQRAWAESHRQHALSAYRYSAGDLFPVNDPSISLDSENKLEIPILVRGNQIGAIEIAKSDPQTTWTKDEENLLHTLSEQLGIALDSARLFNETQLRASTERIIGDINAEIWESLEINSILRTTVEKLQKSLDLPEVSIKMTAPVDQQASSNGNTLDPDENK